MALLQFQREPFVRKLDGVGDEDARRRLVGSTTTLLWLAKHLTVAEDLWLLRRFAGGPGVLLDDTVSDADTIAGAIADYREGWATGAVGFRPARGERGSRWGWRQGGRRRRLGQRRR